MTQADLAVPADHSPDVDGGLEVREVGVSFSGVIATNTVSMVAQRGEVLGLIGPNGAGKTTLFDVVSGLRVPNHGTIIFNGQDITAHSAVRRSRSGIRRTFQRQQVFGRLTVEENLLCASEWKGGGGGILADLVGLPGRRKIEAPPCRRRRGGGAMWIGIGSQHHGRFVADRYRSNGRVGSCVGRVSFVSLARRADIGARGRRGRPAQTRSSSYEAKVVCHPAGGTRHHVRHVPL